MSDVGCIAEHDEREPTLSGLLLCGKHRSRMDRDVTEIGLLIADANLIRDGGAPQEASEWSKHSKKRADPPAPGDVLLMSLFDPATAAARIPARADDDERGWSEGDQSEPVPNVLGVVASWLQLVAEERPLTGDLPRSVIAQLDLLKRHHEWLAAMPYVDDYLIEMAELRKALAGAVCDRVYMRVGSCHLTTDDGPCGGALITKNGDDTVRCAECGATWTDPRERAKLSWRG